ncbi:SIR2 family protein [Verrucomicrobiota bacterium]
MTIPANTVLVLGAGASVDYGFPLGGHLKTNIIAMTKPRGRGAQFLLQSGYEQSKIEEFHRSLTALTHLTTIDTFLLRRKEFRDIGVLMIAKCLLAKERPKKHWEPRGWYVELLRVVDFDTPEKPPPLKAIITFNYDRSLEYFLTRNVDFYHDAGSHRDALLRKTEDIPVVHVYGSLGSLQSHGYGADGMEVDDLRKRVGQAAEQIKMVYDKVDSAPTVQKAQALLAEASAVIFLGFGYDKDNLRRLAVPDSENEHHFFGTAMNEGEERLRNIRVLFKSRITLGGRNQDIAAFLRDTPFDQG